MQEALDQDLLDHLIAEFGERGRWAVENLRTAGALAAAVDLDLPRRASTVSYCLREALKAIPETAADGSTPRWVQLSRDILTAKAQLLEAQAIPGADTSAEFAGLMRRIDDIELLRETASVHERRLISVMLSRTGAAPLTAGTQPVRDYQALIKELDQIVHGNAESPASDTEALWNETVLMLGRLFQPPAVRMNELHALAILDEPSQGDLERLRPRLVSPNHLIQFVKRLTGPRWLRLLFDAGLLDIGDGPQTWAVYPAVTNLGQAHADALVELLDDILTAWISSADKSVHAVRAASMLGRPGDEIVLRALKAHPTSETLTHFAISAAEQRQPDDPYVLDVADIALNPVPWSQQQTYVDPLLSAYVAGTNEENWTSRVRTLCFKLKAVPESATARRIVRDDHGSLESPHPPYEDDPYVALLRTLLACLKKSMDWCKVEDLLSTVDVPGELSGRLRVWLIVSAPNPPVALARSELARACVRHPTADDVQLVKHAMSAEFNAVCAQVRSALGEPPTVATVGKALAARTPEAAWLNVHAWSAILPEPCTEPWRKVIAILSARIGEPSVSAPQARPTARFTSSTSPISEDDMAQMPRDEACRWIAAFRSQDWLSSTRELARVLQAVVKRDPEAWATTPIPTASLLIHPMYISHYLRGLSESASTTTFDVEALVELVELVHTNPWPVEVIGRDDFEFDPDWRAAEDAGVDLVKALAASDQGFGTKSEMSWELVRDAAERGMVDPGGEIQDGFDHLAAAINRRATRAFDAALSFAGYEFRSSGEVLDSHLDLFSLAIQVPGTTGAQYRSIIASRFRFARAVLGGWVEAHSDELFGSAAPPDLGQLTVDMTVRFGGFDRWLMENHRPAVLDSLLRRIENSLEGCLIALLSSTPGYDPAALVARLSSLGLLSDAGESIGRLLRDDGINNSHVAMGEEFWSLAIESGSPALDGFGWMSVVTQVDDLSWSALTLETLKVTGGRIDWSQEVALRLHRCGPTETTLTCFNLMVRGLGHDWDRRDIGESAARMFHIAGDLQGRPAYLSLHTALVERGLA